MPALDLNAIPGYREAVERENNVRDNAFLGIAEKICGIEVFSMTPRHFLILDGIGSPFVTGGSILPEEVVRFLWIMSPRFRIVRSFHDWIARWRFAASCRKLNWETSIKAIFAYLEETFMDRPGANSASNSVGSNWSWLAAMVDAIARNYHWSEETILNTPLKRLFQYRKIISMANDPNAIHFNPRDKVIGEYLRKINNISDN